MTEKLDPTGIGIPSLHSRVESWECDFNGHWNARFYARAFQQAAETLPFLPGLSSGRPGRLPPTRYLRFHRELFAGSAVALRSTLIGGGSYAGAVAHLLISEGRLAATALDTGGAAIHGLPVTPAETLRLAQPRGLAGRTDAVWTDGPGTSLCQTGPIRPAETDHRGDLLFEEVVRRLAFATHAHVSALGLNQALLTEAGISRMAVEARITRLGTCPAGAPLQVKARLIGVAVKSFIIALMVESPQGQPVAYAEYSMVTVDLNTRRAVELPEFLLAGFRG
ncbi:thioesterase [Paracoccus sp. M683]|uniref:thioesterase family protein n=1 Tax=Paracoccus sp. M683 TaxID=2594268 RepID=UPI00117CC0F5|nr:thioesterase family protein [Paracoccus sp. M683]TRW96623.1 thioesterase [Paracoccus sp. M683]